MLSVTYAQLNAWLAAFLWPFVRILALIATMPAFHTTSVPTRVKIGLAIFITLLVSPLLETLPSVTVFSATGVWILINQCGIGIVLGLTMHIVFAAIETAGQLISLQMGLGFASFFDPSTHATSEVLTRYLRTLATLTFFALDGHLHILSALIATFFTLPITAEPLHAQGFSTFIAYGATIFSTGLALALPVVVALLIAHVLLGILNRAAPQIGVFQIGLPVTLLTGLIFLQWALPNMSFFFASLFESGVEQMNRVAAALR